MAGETPLPIQEYCDDSQILSFNLRGAVTGIDVDPQGVQWAWESGSQSDGSSSTSSAYDDTVALLFLADRKIVVDHITGYFVTKGSSDVSVTVNKVASGANLETAGVPITTALDVDASSSSAGDTTPPIAEGTAFSFTMVQTANVVDANSVLVLRFTGPPTALANGLITIRFRSKRR